MTEGKAKRDVYGLVLAGGQSRRMGHDKALLDRGGQSQLAFAVELLADRVDRVFVSTRADQANDAERSQFEQIVDRYDDLGPLAGILSAMEEHPGVDWLVVACDLPNIDARTILYLLDHRTTRKPFVAYASSYNGLPEPLCALYAEGSETVIRESVQDGITCPRKIMIRSDTLLLDQPDPNALDNINTPDDLAGSVLETRP